MSRLIDATAFKMAMFMEVERNSNERKWDDLGYWIRYKLFERVLNKQPTVNAMPVIKCKDCKHWDMVDLHFHKNICSKLMRPCDESDFCSWAERRQDG